MTFEQPSFVSGGNIDRYRFITIGLGADSQANEANANDVLIGITTGGSQLAPQDSANTEAATAAGQTFEWKSAGAVALLKADASGWTRGDRLMSDADGKGDVAASGNWIGAIALTNAAANEISEVLIISPTFYEEG